MFPVGLGTEYYMHLYVLFANICMNILYIIYTYIYMDLYVCSHMWRVLVLLLVVVIVVVPTPMADLVILIFARFLYASKHSA